MALTIGGSDSAGRCGMQADLRTFAALGVHGCCAVTVVTAQDTERVRGAWPLPPAAVAAQVEAVVDDLTVGATKVGMLGALELVDVVADLVVADLAGAGRLGRLVVDPVLVSGTGAALFPTAVVDALRRRLLPSALVVTPNRDELALLTGRTATTPAELAEAAQELAVELAGPVVLASGGRLGGDESVDAVARGDSVTLLETPRVRTVNVAGTGDALSAALVAGLAGGLDIDVAIGAAKAFVTRAVADAAGWKLGAGRGPIDHLGWGRTAAKGAG